MIASNSVPVELVVGAADWRRRRWRSPRLPSPSWSSQQQTTATKTTKATRDTRRLAAAVAACLVVVGVVLLQPTTPLSPVECSIQPSAAIVGSTNTSRQQQQQQRTALMVDPTRRRTGAEDEEEGRRAREEEDAAAADEETAAHPDTFEHYSRRRRRRAASQPIDNATIGFVAGEPVAADAATEAPDDGAAVATEWPQAAAQVSAVGRPQSGAGAAAASSELSNLVASQQAAAYALAQEANKAASKLNAELCKDFSVGSQDATGGTFTSPNYPNPYPVNLICTRLIEAPTGHYIVLEFRDQFNIEEAGNDCDNDKIEIRDGRYGYSKVLARYCGSKFPPEVKSTNEAMWLRFISDGSISHNGFMAVYRFEKQKNTKPNPPFECRFNVTANVPATANAISNLNNNLAADSGAAVGSGGAGNTSTELRTGIHSGVIRNSDVPDKLIDYTKQFNVSLECIWNITVMPGWKIYLTFSNYELNKPNDCDSNFIEIYEENLTEENQTVKFCGTRTEPQQSKSNVFNIRHHALPTASGSRFEIIYTAFRDKGLEGCDAAREFDCDDGTCIHASLKCDGQINCKYRYDEASDPGPCLGDATEGSFFETEHMVIILVVFLTLVSGMCASIIISCWGKILERRKRKLEYHMRKSREASVEGQLNKVDQLLYGTANERNSNSNGTGQAGLKQRLAAGGPMNASTDLSQTSAKFSLEATGGAGSATNASQRFLVSQDSLQQQPHPLQQFQQASQMLAASQDSGGVGNYGGLYGAQTGGPMGALLSNGSLAGGGGGGGARGAKVHAMELAPEAVNRSLQNVQQSILASRVAQHQKQQQQAELSKQQSVPDVSHFSSNQFKQLQQQQQQQQLLLTGDNHTIATHDNSQQQMLNLSLARQQSQNLSQQQQQQQQFISSISHSQQQQQHLANDNDNNNNNNNNNSQKANSSAAAAHYGRYLRHQPSNVGAGGPVGLPLFTQTASAQTMPISLAKYNSLLQAHMLNSSVQTDQLSYDTNQNTPTGPSQFTAAAANHPQAAYSQQRALTLSTMHQPHPQLYGQRQQQQQQRHALQATGIYGPADQHIFAGQPLNTSHLSSSISCCNYLGDQYLGETPLISDLVARASQQQQHRQQRLQQAAAGGRVYVDDELRSATMGPGRLASASIPRSISAHQLSRAQLRQQQQQQPAAAAAQQLHLIQRQVPAPAHHQQQLSYTKSMSDAGHANKHQPPNHSLSYPHACPADLHRSSAVGAAEEATGSQRNQSPALPPPPPPPNLVQVRGPASLQAAQQQQQPQLSSGQQQQQQHQPMQMGDTRRAAFKVSRLDPSQLTGDTLQDSEMLVANMPLGSMQFDEPSTESDPTFGGLLMNSIGNTPLNLAGHHLAAAGGGQFHGSVLAGRQQPARIDAQQQQQQQLFQLGASGSSFPQLQRQPRVLTHLNACKAVRQQQQQHQSNLMGRPAEMLSNQPLVCDCGALERAAAAGTLVRKQQSAHQQQQQQLHLQQQASSSREFEDSDEAAECMMQSAVPHHSLDLSGGMLLTQSMVSGQQQQQQQHSNLNGSSLYGRQQQYARFRQQSSEMTAEDDDDDDDAGDDDDADMEADDDEMDGLAAYNMEDDASSELALPTSQQQQQRQQPPQQAGLAKVEYRVRPPVVRNEELHDAPGRHLSGSHTSISCQSCTCGSQLQLDRAGANDNDNDDDDDEDDAGQCRQEADDSMGPKATTVAGRPTSQVANQQQQQQSLVDKQQQAEAAQASSSSSSWLQGSALTTGSEAYGSANKGQRVANSIVGGAASKQQQQPPAPLPPPKMVGGVKATSASSAQNCDSSNSGGNSSSGQKGNHQILSTTTN